MIDLLSKRLFLLTFFLFPASLMAEEKAPINLMPVDVALEAGNGTKPSVEELRSHRKKKKLPKNQYIQRGLDKINFPLGSPVLTDILQRLVLERISPEDPVFLTGQKLKLLYKLGKFRTVIQHLTSVPEKRQSNQLMKCAFLAMCFQPKLDGKRMHKIANKFYTHNKSEFWRQATTFSEILIRNSNRAELALHLMRDHEIQGGSQFLKLMDNFLYGMQIDGFKRPSMIELAVARLAKVKFPKKLLESTSLPMSVAIVFSENLPIESRILAAEKALDQGAIGAEILIFLYDSAQFGDDLVIQTQKTKGILSQKLLPHMKRALLYQAAKSSAGERRAEILHNFWKLDNGISYESLAAVSYPLLKALVPDEDLGWFAPEAFKVLSLFTNNDYARVWETLAEQESPELWLSISPFVYLAVSNTREPVDQWFKRWFHVKSTRDPNRVREKALLLANLLNAIGKPLQKHTLRDLEITYRSDAHPEILDLMYSKSQEGRTVEEVIISASKKMSKIQSQKDWIRLSQVVGKLKQFGLHKEASRLAVEIAMKNQI